jgi:hypothetical protein
MKHAIVIIQALLLAGWSGMSPALTAAAPAAEAETPSVPLVHYDGSTDRLSLEAEDASLTGILVRISRLSGVEILVHPDVERRITARIDNQPLEQGLATLTRGLNSVLVHDIRSLPGEEELNMLVTVKLLPPGQTNTALLMPVLSPEAEALIRADRRDRTGARVPGLANDRRLARLQKLPPEQREKVEQIEVEQVSKKLQRTAEKAERRAERKRDKLALMHQRLERLQGRGFANPERHQARISELQRDIAGLLAELSGTTAP